MSEGIKTVANYFKGKKKKKKKKKEKGIFQSLFGDRIDKLKAGSKKKKKKPYSNLIG